MCVYEREKKRSVLTFKRGVKKVNEEEGLYEFYTEDREKYHIKCTIFYCF